MDTVKKILPDGRDSWLSLNEYKPDAADIPAAWNAVKGEDLYSMALIRKLLLAYFPELSAVGDFSPMGFIRRNYGNPGITALTNRLSEGLAILLSSLIEGSSRSRQLNHLSDADWEIWAGCKHVILDGGMVKGPAANAFLDHLRACLADRGVSVKADRTLPIDGIRTMSLLGCAVPEPAYYNTIYVFDFGNSKIKSGRCLRIGKKLRLEELPGVLHKDFWNMKDDPETARMLHETICETIVNTLDYYEDFGPEYRIGMCFANNYLRHQVSNRGSYRSLRLLGDDYRSLLQKSLESQTGKRVSLSLYNDAEAVANLYQKWAPDAAVITLGTHLGIAYPHT
jgi:hypothetical protein